VAALPASPLDLAERRRRLQEVLDRHDGNRSAAARELGVSRKTVHQWLKST
jgi:transcriptional regulator with PAS, ATPase and Fis domain